MTPRETINNLISTLADLYVPATYVGDHIFPTVNGFLQSPVPYSGEIVRILSNKATAIPWIYQHYRRAARSYSYAIYPLYRSDKGENITYKGDVVADGIPHKGVWYEYYRERTGRYLLGKCKRLIYSDEISNALKLPIVGDGVVELEGVYGEGPCTVLRLGYSCAPVAPRKKLGFDRALQLQYDYGYDAMHRVLEWAQQKGIDQCLVTEAMERCKETMPEFRDLQDVKNFVAMAQEYVLGSIRRGSNDRI